MEGREANDQQEASSSRASIHSGGESVSPSKEKVVCKVCGWTGKSLRGHLVRSNSHCRNFYDMDQLAEDAKKIHLQKMSKWECEHRAQRSEERSRKRHTPQKDSPVKRTSLSKSKSPASPRKQSKSAVSMDLSDEAVESVKKLSLREEKCRNCSYNKGNLRRHLAHTTKECSNSYSEEERMALKNEADNVRRDKKEQWQKANRETTQEVCQVCHKVYVGNINRHMAEAHSSETHKCPKCPRMFPRKHYLTDHLHTVHGEKTYASHSTVCSECNKEFSLFQALARHRLEVHNESAPFYCSICKFSFARKEHLDRHNYEIHEEFKNFITCKQCKDEGNRVWKFVRGEHFTRHVEEVHNKGKNWHCDQCPKRFARWANLHRHISIEHDEEIMFTCPVCSRNFNWKEKLDRHMKDVHHEESKFECDGCSKNFSRLENLQRHQNSNNCKIPYECEYCHENLRFKSKEEAREHFKWRKGKKGTYSCVNVKKSSHSEWAESILEGDKRCKEISARRARHEITEKEAEGIIKSKEDYDYRYRPYEFDDSFLDPGSRCPMHYPVRGRCGHVFCKEQFINTQMNFYHRDTCPWSKRTEWSKRTGEYEFETCEVKVDLNDLVIDVDMSEEIERRKAERKKQKEAGLWPMTGLNLTGNHTGVDQKSAFRPYGYGGDKALRVCRCNECDKIYDSIYSFMRHYRDVHKKTEPPLDKEETLTFEDIVRKHETKSKSPEKPKETREPLCCSFCEPEPDFSEDPDQMRNHILAEHPELKIIW